MPTRGDREPSSGSFHGAMCRLLKAPWLGPNLRLAQGVLSSNDVALQIKCQSWDSVSFEIVYVAFLVDLTGLGKLAAALNAARRAAAVRSKAQLLHFTLASNPFSTSIAHHFVKLLDSFASTPSPPRVFVNSFQMSSL